MLSSIEASTKLCQVCFFQFLKPLRRRREEEKVVFFHKKAQKKFALKKMSYCNLVFGQLDLVVDKSLVDDLVPEILMFLS